MAVFRVEKTKDFTIMCNHHLRNTELSLKAKGLLSLMLSLPEDWDYTTKGLAHICKHTQFSGRLFCPARQAPWNRSALSRSLSPGG